MDGKPAFSGVLFLETLPRINQNSNLESENHTSTLLELCNYGPIMVWIFMKGIGLKPAFRGKHGLGNLCFVRPTVSKHRQKTDLWLAPRRKRERIPSLFQYNGLKKIAKILLPCGDNRLKNAVQGIMFVEPPNPRKEWATPKQETLRSIYFPGNIIFSWGLFLYCCFSLEEGRS